MQHNHTFAVATPIPSPVAGRVLADALKGGPVEWRHIGVGFFSMTDVEGRSYPFTRAEVEEAMSPRAADVIANSHGRAVVYDGTHDEQRPHYGNRCRTCDAYTSGSAIGGVVVPLCDACLVCELRDLSHALPF